METSSTLRHLLAEERTLDAWAALQQHDSWETWSDPLNLIEAGRVLSACGDQWKAEKMRWRAWTLSPETPEAAYYRVSRIYRRHGACEALRWLDCHRPATEAVPSSVAEADILAMRARILAVFRDFTAADALMQRALGAFPDHAWLWMEHAGLLRAQDRYEEALDASARLIELAPWRNWAVRTRVDLLQLQNRDAEALDLVSEAVSRTQNGYLAVLLASAHESAGRDADILRALDLAEARLPLADRSDRRWIAARRSDAHHRLGETEAALAQARVAAELGYGYYKPMVERLSAPPPAPRRVRLPVGFVRQHHMTCAPATVAAITGYWGAAIDHQAMARDICYDGTPDHAERAWLQERGWLVREFTVDWDAAVALLDRGCPFMIVTTAVGSAHMQAVIGYDSTLRTFLVRDPYLQTFQEWNAEPVLKEQAAYGPRGVLVLPAAEKGRASDLTLPDEMILDEWFAFRRACHRHDRPAAQAALEGLERLGPGHVLALRARRDLAHYDGHVPGALAPVGALRERFPEDVNLQLEEIDLLERLGREHEARALVEKLGAGISKAFTLQRRRAETRIADARTASSAGRILRRLVRLSPGADHLRAYADFLWDAGERAEATRLYRLAATSADKVEAHWRVYFNASRQLGIEAECLALLRERFARWGDRAPYPAMTLHGVLADLDRDLEADEVLAEARRRLPKDGDLALYAAGRAARLSRHEEAEAILAEARPWCVPAAWSRVAARAAEIAAEHARALGLWRELLALDPANVEAQESCARLLRITEGRAAALAHLRAAGASLPRLEPLHRLVIEWLRAEPAEEALAAVEARLALVGEDAWLLRERAFVLRRLGRAEEGLASARIALAMEPRSPPSWGAAQRARPAWLPCVLSPRSCAGRFHFTGPASSSRLSRADSSTRTSSFPCCGGSAAISPTTGRPAPRSPPASATRASARRR